MSIKTGTQTEAPMFLRAADIAEMLRCSESTAYKIIQKLNAEMEKKGKLTLSGRVSRRYAEERLLWKEDTKGDTSGKQRRP